MLPINLMNFIHHSKEFKKHVKKHDIDAEVFLQILLSSYVEGDRVFVKCFFDYGDLGKSAIDFHCVVEVLDQNKFAYY